LILKVICNLRLGNYKNVYKAKQTLTTGSILRANFGQDDLCQVIKDFKFETKGTLELVSLMLPKMIELLNASLDQFQKLQSSENNLDALHILVNLQDSSTMQL
jgi:hypothetical protein